MPAATRRKIAGPKEGRTSARNIIGSTATAQAQPIPKPEIIVKYMKNLSDSVAKTLDNAAVSSLAGPAARIESLESKIQGLESTLISQARELRALGGSLHKLSNAVLNLDAINPEKTRAEIISIAGKTAHYIGG